MKKPEYSAEYICTHLGEENIADQNFGAVVPPLYATSLHVFKSAEDLLGFDSEAPEKQYLYGRVDNPTVNLLEKKLAALEGAEGALCFASGMAAISSAVLHCVKPGDHLVSVSNAYGPARRFFDSMLKKIGVEVSYVTGSDPEDFRKALRENTTLFYLESPTSCVMELQDLAAVSAIAKERGVKTVIDNTWATPIYQKPLALGVDIVVHTMSKYIGGHSDIIGGALCAEGATIAAIKREERELLGGIIGPFEAWLAIRGLRSMPARLEKSGKNAQQVAEFLEKHPRVRKVNYPGLPSFSQYELGQRQMSGYSGLLSFEMQGTPEESIAIANRLEIFRRGVSWGGFESLVCLPTYNYSEEEAARQNTSRNLLRIYCGLEDAETLIADLRQALEK